MVKRHSEIKFKMTPSVYAETLNQVHSASKKGSKRRAHIIVSLLGI